MATGALEQDILNKEMLNLKDVIIKDLQVENQRHVIK